MSTLFASPADVLALTQITATADQIREAQGILEVFTGRSAAEFDSAYDYELMRKAVSYQTAYMAANRETVFRQVDFLRMNDNEFSAAFNTKDGSPFIAPLAVMAVRKLSNQKSHSIKTGKVFQ